MLLLAGLAFTTVLALSCLVLFETLQANGGKILAALEGHSLLSEPTLVTRPVTVRISSRRVSRPATARPQLRAAA